MKFGLFFPHQLPKPWSPDAEYRLFQDALEVVEIADRIGIQYAWAQEHHFLEEYSHSTAPEVFLAACSQRTKRIRLGHGVSIMPPKVNHPARVAERVATLDLVSGGRVEWGTGEMSSRIELEGFGIEYVDKRPMWAEAVREAARMMALTPYPGFEGKFFSMPPRNIVPKPFQRPHPPLWVACTNRETLKLAARLGAGALTFAFVAPSEAKFWVEEYYEVFERECAPIGRMVNPNVATLIGFHCGRSAEDAARAELDQRFFRYGLAHYYRHGLHTPGHSRIWDDFCALSPEPMAGLDGIGRPEELAERFAAYEAVGVDQLILLQQAGMSSVEAIKDSLELFGSEVLPAFLEREKAAACEKADRLASIVATAQAKIEPIDVIRPEPVESYPALWDRTSGNVQRLQSGRALEAASLWNLHVGAGRVRE